MRFIATRMSSYHARNLLLVVLIAFSLFMAPSAQAREHGNHKSHREMCGFKRPKEEKLRMNEKIQEEITRRRRRTRSALELCDGCITINVYSHVIISSKPEENYVTQEIMDLQMKVINENFAGSPFRFVDAETKFIVDDRFASNSGDFADEAASLYRKKGSGYNDLNAFYSDGWGNFAILSGLDKRDPNDLLSDGVWVNSRTLPGLDAENLGYTLTHEGKHTRRGLLLLCRQY